MLFASQTFEANMAPTAAPEFPRAAGYVLARAIDQTSASYGKMGGHRLTMTNVLHSDNISRRHGLEFTWICGLETMAATHSQCDRLEHHIFSNKPFSDAKR